MCAPTESVEYLEKVSQHDGLQTTPFSWLDGEWGSTRTRDTSNCCLLQASEVKKKMCKMLMCSFELVAIPAEILPIHLVVLTDTHFKSIQTPDLNFLTLNLREKFYSVRFLNLFFLKCEKECMIIKTYYLYCSCCIEQQFSFNSALFKSK